MYNAADWLCECNIKNAFFHFMCLVIKTNDTAWTVMSVKDFKNC